MDAAEGSTSAAERPYHHGDLRAALLSASLELLAAHGLDGFSVAAAARAVGVSTAAPYRHFASREELLAAVATQAAKLVRAELQAQLVAAGADPSRRFTAATALYARLTVTRGAGVQVIFAPGLPDPDGCLKEAAGELMALMLGVAQDACGPETAGELLSAQLALAHGYATLYRQRYYASQEGALDALLARAARGGALLLAGARTASLK